jgi:hypothetical protein
MHAFKVTGLVVPVAISIAAALMGRPAQARERSQILAP